MSLSVARARREEMESSAPGTGREWSELPGPPLATIAGLLLPSLRDLFSFAAVCPSWRSLLRPLLPSFLPSLPPLLLALSIPNSSSDDDEDFSEPPSSRSDPPTLPFRLHSPSVPRLTFSPSPLDLPLPDFAPPSPSLRFLSFSHGYLLFLPSSPPLQPFLANTITNSRILLPPLPSDYHRFPYYYATLTAPPSDPSSRFLLFFSKFAFLSCHLSSSSSSSSDTDTTAWTRHRYSPNISFITHVVTYKNRLFGLNDSARLLELDLSPGEKHVVRFVNVRRPPRSPLEFDRWKFGPQLVCTPDQIYLVLFVLFDQTGSFSRPGAQPCVKEPEIYSLDWRRMEWVQVKRLHDCAMFIDCVGKAPVLCPEPERWGGRSNTVYIAGPWRRKWVKFPLHKKMMWHLRNFGIITMDRHLWPSPIWVHPSLLYG